MNHISFLLLGLLIIGCAQKESRNEYILGSTLWFQTSGEAKALQLQAYEVARSRLLADLQDVKKKNSGKRAVVLDIDETVLDNSPYEALVIKSGEPYPAGWPEWIARKEAEPVPGAIEFLKFADSRGVKIFYLTNRKEKYKKDTSENLSKKGFPQVTDETVLCSGGEWSKESRRKAISENYRIVLLVGDNLNDFSEVFANKGVEDRAKAVETQAKKFGTEFIVLPNPMYGDWEGALYDHRWDTPVSEKVKRRQAWLKSY